MDLYDIKWIMNPYDEFAVEEALRLKEKTSLPVCVLSVGPKSRISECLRTALAMGADEAVAIDAPENLDNFSTAKALSLAIQKEGPLEYIFTGKLAIDDNMSCVSQMLAEFLNLPHVTVVSKFESSGPQQAFVTREVEGGEKEILEIKGPAVLGATKGLNTPRYASLPGIMKAKKKPLKNFHITELGVTEQDQKIHFSHFELPKERGPVKHIEGEPQQQAEELIRLLRQEAKVL